MTTSKKKTQSKVSPPKTQFVVDEIHVQVQVREVNEQGETITKHMAEPIRFVNEVVFREWASKPLRLHDQRDA